MSVSEQQTRELVEKFATDFGIYSQRILKIRPKSGGKAIPFFLNTAQRHIHEKVTTQQESIGKVRAIILKGRQQGASTYVEGRFYWRISHRRGVKGYILTHEQKATDNLFGMVQRYYDESPSDYRPHLGASNAKELVFDVQDSRYEVATAGSKDTGRSGTAQYLHGSEVAFWQQAAQHLAGIGQVVPDERGTRSSWRARPTERPTCFTSSGRWRARARANTCRFSCHGSGRPSTNATCLMDLN